MSSQKRDRFKLALMGFLVLMILATIGLYALTAAKSQGFNLGNLLPVAITLLIILFMAFFIIRRYQDIKQKQPLEDERSRQVMTQAAAKAFYISIYWLLAISWFESFFAQKLFQTAKLDAGQAVGGGIAGMALIFFSCWLYYNRRGL
ncbi:MAG: DUF2178 domain-containing protein [bacterium]